MNNRILRCEYGWPGSLTAHKRCRVVPKYAPDAMAGVHKLKIKLLHVSFFSMRILKIRTRDVREAVKCLAPIPITISKIL